MSTPKPPKLIVSDIDGTLLDSNGRVSSRLRDTITRAARMGTKIALATGRPHRWLTPVLDQLPFTPDCICANGAVVYDPSRDEVLVRHESVSYTHLTLPTIAAECRSRWSPCH